MAEERPPPPRSNLNNYDLNGRTLRVHYADDSQQQQQQPQQQQQQAGPGAAGELRAGAVRLARCGWRGAAGAVRLTRCG
jgi:hypothetical protein